MSRLYTAALRVKPFITAPVAEQQQTLVLAHRSFSRDIEAFVTKTSMYQHTHAPTLPIICHVFTYDGRLLVGTTIETSVPERSTGRIGTNLTFGALIEADAIHAPHLTVLIHEQFQNFFQECFGVDASPEGIATVLDIVQRTPEQPLPSPALAALVREFERTFGLTSWVTSLPQVIRRTYIWLVSRRAPRLASVDTVYAASAYWMTIDRTLASAAFAPPVTPANGLLLLVASVPLVNVAALLVQRAAASVNQETQLAVSISFALMDLLIIGGLTGYRCDDGPEGRLWQALAYVSTTITTVLLAVLLAILYLS